MIATWATIIGIAVSMADTELLTWKKWTIPLAVTLGELAWFAILAGLTRRYETSLDDTTIAWIVRSIGAVLVVLGSWGLLQKLLGAW